MILSERGSKENGAPWQVPLKPTTQPRICEELACYMEEFLELMNDSGRFNLRPKELLHHYASREEANMWFTEFKQYFERKELST